MILQIPISILFLVCLLNKKEVTIPFKVNEPKRNFGLKADEFDELVTRLKLGQTEIFKSIFLNHFEECTSYLIKQFGAQYDDAYDSSMATLLRFRKRLVEDKIRYGNLRFLFTRMASQHYQRSFKNKAVALNEGYDIPEETTNNFEEADISQLESAWKKLDLKCKELLKMNYYQNMKLVEIASIQNINAATLRKQKERCKAKLIEYFQK